jgi:FAD/FMN-containing dehydrogenase
VSRTITVAGLDGRPVAVGADELATLAGRIGGRLLAPGDDGWDDAVRVWNAMVARTPALVVQPVSSRDVAETVDFVRRRGLVLSIKGGGHHIAGTSIADGGIVLDMARMSTVTVDAAARRAHVGPGCLLRDVDRATQAHGLATVLGFVSEVGVAGLTLGGGLGYLTRRFGWSVDNLESVEIVTADGDIRIADRDHAPDLFWAIRGGGGNFGVVTRFTFRLHPVGPDVHGGLIAWPFGRADEILRAYRRMTAEAPRELSAWLILLRAPDAPFVPAPWRGERVCAMSVCYSGPLDRAAEALAPIHALGDPVFDLLRDQPYAELQSQLDGTEPAGRHYYWKTEYARELPDDLLAAWRTLAADCPVPDGQLGILHLAGALEERAPDDGAVGNRDARYALGVLAAWDAGEPEATRFRAWVRDAWPRFRAYSTGGNYINFQTDDEGTDRIRAAYGTNLDRLLAVKRRYDPDNLFRVNRNLTGSPRPAG